MHPGFVFWWKRHHRGQQAWREFSVSDCGPGASPPDFGRGDFGRGECGAGDFGRGECGAGEWLAPGRGGEFAIEHPPHEHGHHGPHHGPGPHHGRGHGGPRFGFGSGFAERYFAHSDERGGFGVRRPLRFLAHRLDLTEEQIGGLASILDSLKIERAQASVDHRRTTAALADSVESGTFDAAKAAAAADERARSAERMQAAVIAALEKIHSLLTEEQRKRFSYLLRTGQLEL